MSKVLDQYKDYSIEWLKNQMLCEERLVGDKTHNDCINALFDGIKEDNLAIKVVAKFLLNAMQLNTEIRKSHSAKWICQIGFTKTDVKAFNSICKSKNLNDFYKKTRKWFEKFERSNRYYQNLNYEKYSSMKIIFKMVAEAFEE